MALFRLTNCTEPHIGAEEPQELHQVGVWPQHWPHLFHWPAQPLQGSVTRAVILPGTPLVFLESKDLLFWGFLLLFSFLSLRDLFPVNEHVKLTLMGRELPQTDWQASWKTANPGQVFDHRIWGWKQSLRTSSAPSTKLDLCPVYTNLRTVSIQPMDIHFQKILSMPSAEFLTASPAGHVPEAKGPAPWAERPQPLSLLLAALFPRLDWWVGGARESCAVPHVLPFGLPTENCLVSQECFVTIAHSLPSIFTEGTFDGHILLLWQLSTFKGFTSPSPGLPISRLWVSAQKPFLIIPKQVSLKAFSHLCHVACPH